MGVLDPGRFVERQQFFDGQRLFAVDLQQLEAFHREMRELHNRSLHQPGIGAGLAVSGNPGDREVVIGPGYALDLDGHEIVLTSDHREPVPPVDGDPDGTPAVYDLAVSYPSDELLEVAETRAGVCVERGAVRLRELPVFCWVRLVDDGSGALRPFDSRLRDDLDVGRRILLARAEVQHCKLVRLSIAERRNARPPSHPQVVCGHASPRWRGEVIPLGDDVEAGTLVLEALIDTAATGFVTTPCYSARLDGPRELAPIIDGEVFNMFAEGVVGIEDSTSESFMVRVLIPPGLLLGISPGLAAEHAERVFAPWRIEWMGVA